MSTFYYLIIPRSDSSSTEKVCVDIPKQAPIEEDSDLEVEESMPPLDSVIRKELLRKMKPKEKKLQEVINGGFCLLSFLLVVCLRFSKSTHGYMIHDVNCIKIN